MPVAMIIVQLKWHVDIFCDGEISSRCGRPRAHPTKSIGNPAAHRDPWRRGEIRSRRRRRRPRLRLVGIASACSSGDFSRRPGKQARCGRHRRRHKELANVLSAGVSTIRAVGVDVCLRKCRPTAIRSGRGEMQVAGFGQEQQAVRQALPTLPVERWRSQSERTIGPRRSVL